MGRKRKEIEVIKEELSRRTPSTPLSTDDLLSTGSTLLNLACTGHWQGGFAKGMYFLLVGDSSSGKTFLSLTCLAEAAKNESFDGYRFVHDNVEGGALMDIERFFGGKVAGRMESPGNGMSETTEDFFFNLDDVLGQGRPVIYILDSMDALSSESEGKRFVERKEAYRKGSTTTGDYGDGKAKANARGIRAILPKLRDTGSILIVINQTRDNVGGNMFEPRKIRSGGHAMTFYSTVEAWASIGGQLKKTYRGKERQQGIVSKIRVKKNRFTGRLRTVSVPIYHSFGIDDVGSCIDYLLSEKHWTNKGKRIEAKEFDFAGDRVKVIEHVLSNNLEDKLSEIVAGVWNEIEEAVSEDRKRRYD